MRFKFKLLVVVKMLKKKLGIEAIEKDSWTLGVLSYSRIGLYFKIPPTLVIPDGCKWIGDWAFWRCKKLRKVVIPESVVEIRDFAFKECRDLEEVEIPKSVKNIGVGAFRECKKLEKVAISEGVEWISTKSFCECWKLKKVEIPKSVRWIGDGAFEGCKKATIILQKPKNEFKEIQLRAFSGVKNVRYAKEEVRN